MQNSENLELQHKIQQLIEQYSKSGSSDEANSQETGSGQKSATPNTRLSAAEDRSWKRPKNWSYGFGF